MTTSPVVDGEGRQPGRVRRGRDHRHVGAARHQRQCDHPDRTGGADRDPGVVDEVPAGPSTGARGAPGRLSTHPVRLWDSHPDGCNTRYQVLIRDAQRAPQVGAGCYLTHGRWVSPYDGVATTDPVHEQIDHVVPLEAAWAAGAWKWNANTRERFANDLGTTYDLLAVSAHSNESKGDDGPDRYLPPRKSFDCRYMADYTAILWRWKLSIDPTEKAFLQSHLAGCRWPSVAEPARPAIAVASHPASTSSHHGCTRTSTGKCIVAGEFCPDADRGRTGYDGTGKKLVCEGSGEPHWKEA